VRSSLADAYYCNLLQSRRVSDFCSFSDASCPSELCRMSAFRLLARSVMPAPMRVLSVRSCQPCASFVTSRAAFNGRWIEPLRVSCPSDIANVEVIEVLYQLAFVFSIPVYVRLFVES